jgi:hypothetical protein
VYKTADVPCSGCRIYGSCAGFRQDCTCFENDRQKVNFREPGSRIFFTEKGKRDHVRRYYYVSAGLFFSAFSFPFRHAYL